MQVVEPSVSLAAVLHGTAFTVFVEPSGPATSRPGPLSSFGNGPVEYGVGGVPAGAYVGAGLLARGVESGSEIGGGLGSGGG
jgi:hypothetical protein